MAEEIDVSSYFKVLRRYWIAILAVALVAAVTAFILTSMQPASYEASSVVVVTQPRYRMEFDPRFATSQNWRPAPDAFPTLATSDAVLQGVVDAYTPSTGTAATAWRLSTLRGMVEARSGRDPSLLILEVRSPSAQDAALIANVWADIVVQAGQDLFGSGTQDVAFFEDQLSRAADALDAANAAAVEFETRSQAAIATTQLESLLQAQAEYLNDQLAIAKILQDIRGLRQQLAEKPDETVTFADGLAALMLQIKAFNTRFAASEELVSTPIELRFDSRESLTNTSPAEQVVFLDSLALTLQAKSAEIEDRLAELEPQILTVQGTVQEFTAERDALTLAQQSASETYLTLARKLDEANIAAQEDNGSVQVVSHAAVPERPADSGRLSKVVVAGMLGLVVGVVGALIYDYWRSSGGQEPRAEE